MVPISGFCKLDKNIYVEGITSVLLVVIVRFTLSPIPRSAVIRQSRSSIREEHRARGPSGSDKIISEISSTKLQPRSLQLYAFRWQCKIFPCSRIYVSHAITLSSYRHRLAIATAVKRLCDSTRPSLCRERPAVHDKNTARR